MYKNHLGDMTSVSLPPKPSLDPQRIVIWVDHLTDTKTRLENESSMRCGCWPSDLSIPVLQLVAPGLVSAKQVWDILPEREVIAIAYVVDSEPVLVTRDGPLGEMA